MQFGEAITVYLLVAYCLVADAAKNLINALIWLQVSFPVSMVFSYEKHLSCQSVIGYTDCRWHAFLHVLDGVKLTLGDSLGSHCLLYYLSGRHEFCMAQFFNVTCGPSQVLLMEHAEFGRMREGTCIKNSNVNLGCTSNVLPFMHSRCSGRRSCEVYIAEPALHQYNPCTADFVSYLEAEYSCIPGEWAHNSFNPVCNSR